MTATTGEIRCERTDLPAAYCSHCRGLPWTAPPIDTELDPFSLPLTPSSDRGPGPLFASAYPGTCASCGADIIPGDMIRADGDGGYECTDCTRGTLS